MVDSAWFVSSDIGFIVGYNGLVFKTSNSGETWNDVNSGTDKWLNSIFFTNEGNGWIVGSDGVILKYLN
ncbi:MAG TPA: YCF48-related protein [Ignavibacteriaceae bacterium]|nr:hypothetical protein [Ignavibacterium sp.]HRP91453.1 YCF48-related protein [Ignavibacteriaceae bacterium]HRQ53472.1 YCF48-related protein [Ignavibacteriaceae bacterium]